ncbi:MAG: sensor histidine kinase [bacterium]
MKKLLKNILIGFIIWTAYTFLNAGILSIQQKLYYPYAWISSAIYNYVMALLSIPLWYFCKQFPFDKSRIFLFFGIHIFSSFLFSAIWLASTFSLYWLIIGEFISRLMWSQGVHLWQFLDGITKYGFLVGIFYIINLYKKIKEKELIEAELSLLAKNMELQNLKSQINPHFLFNALNSVNALIAKDPEKARSMNAKLAQLFRYSLDGYVRKFVTLKQELDFIHNYLDIEKVRFGNKLYIHQEIDSKALETEVPSMILQPLVENAIKHGISKIAKGGELNIQAHQNGNLLNLEVSDTGKGITEQNLSKIFEKGLGLKNTNERLKRIYGDAYGLEVKNMQPQGFSVIIKIPQR